MDIYQLKTFVTVAAEGSITKASELLFLSQPAVSAHIKALEDELGLELFHRTAKGMSISAKGRELLPKAMQLLQLQRELLQDAKRLKGQLHDCISLGANRGVSAKILGQLLHLIAQQHPTLTVKMQYGSSAEILQAIQNGSIDAGFHTSTDTTATLHSIEAGRYGIFVAAPPGWVSASAEPDWQQLAEYPWLLPDADTCCGLAAAQLFASRSFSPNKVVRVDQEQMTRALIAAGVGIGLLHSDNALDAEAKAEVQLLALAKQDAQIWFSCLQSRQHQPALAAIITLLQTSPE